MTYLGAAPTTTASRKSQVTYRYLMTAGQSVISGSDLNNNTLSCDPLDTEVFMNGLKLDSTDTTITSTQVTLAVAAAAGDEIEVVAYRTFESADHYDKSTSDTRYVNASGDTMTGDLTISSTAGQLKLTDTDGTEQNTTIKQSGGNVFIQARDNTNNAGIVFAGNGGGNYDEHMRINASGYVTKPNQPSFHAGISAHDTRASGYYNHSTGSSWMTVHNTGNHFSSGTFTAPVAGVYQFNVTLAAAYTNVHVQYWNVVFQKNGSGYIGQNWNGWPSGMSLYKSINNQCTISLQANDYVRVISECNTSLQTFGSSSGSNSIFSGFLIG